LYILSSVTTNSMDIASFLPLLDMHAGEEGLYAQCLIRGSVLGKRHLDTAFVNAVKNFAYGTNYARTFTLEVLVMLSGQRQIKEALEHFGLTDEKSFLLFLTPRDGVEGLIRDFSLENLITFKKKFDIKFGESLSVGRERLLRVLGLTEEPIITGKVQKNCPDLFPDEQMLYKLLALAGIEISDKESADPKKIEKMVCEKINLIPCK